MLKPSSQSFTPEANKRRVIIIPRLVSCLESLAPQDSVNKPTNNQGSNLKQNADMNNPFLEADSAFLKPRQIASDIPRSQGFKPSTEMSSMHFDLIFSSLCQLKQEIGVLAGRLEVMERRVIRMDQKEDSETQVGGKKKRRKAQEIVKNFFCHYPSCQKAYGSEMSLNLHTKLKHNKEQNSQVSEERHASSLEDSERQGDDRMIVENQGSVSSK